MNKADQLLKSMGGAIHESASHRGTPAAMPLSPASPSAASERMTGVARSKVALEIPHAKIEPDPDQPREEFDEDAITRLAESIRTRGQIQPITVRWVEERSRYVIIAGERRWRASGRAGVTTMSCVVLDRVLTASELLALQCIENLLREDLRPIEQAKAFRNLMDTNGWSGNQLAKELGISQPAVVAAMKLLSLPAQVQQMVDAGSLPASSASAIATLEEPEAQVAVAARVVAQGMSRAEVVEAVRDVASRPSKTDAGKGRGSSKAKPKRPTVRIVKLATAKVTIEFRKPVEPAEVAAALREALGRIEAEQVSDLAA